MVLTKKNILMASASVALAVNFSACKKDKEESQTDKLVGEWEITTLGGQALEYAVVFDFERDMDFGYCYSDDNGTYCYSGDWSWENDEETDLKMQTVEGSETTIFEIAIDNLTDNILEGDFSSDGFNASIQLTKIN